MDAIYTLVRLRTTIGTLTTITIFTVPTICTSNTLGAIRTIITLQTFNTMGTTKTIRTFAIVIHFITIDMQPAAYAVSQTFLAKRAAIETGNPKASAKRIPNSLIL